MVRIDDFLAAICTVTVCHASDDRFQVCAFYNLAIFVNRERVFKIDFKKYYDMGYRGILFDIDNTLVRHNEPATSRAIQLMEQLKAMGFKVCLVSNNKEPRVAAFNKKMKVNYIFKAGKPSKKGYIRAMNEIGCNIDNTIAVGDQIYTDIIGSASLGIHTILVKPIDTSHEEIQITLKRIIEKPFIFYFRKKHGMVR